MKRVPVESQMCWPVTNRKIPGVIFLSLCIQLFFAGNVIAEQSQVLEEKALNLHVPSPDWRDQIIYLLMIDRFADGDPSNNDQGGGEYDPSRESHYNGGDLLGVQQRLDYIQNLGATTVWLTPPVANQWWDPVVNYGGYHGYWARDFKSIDEHFGDLDDYKHLSHSLHTKGMYLMHDIVVNHVGNYFGYRQYDEADPSSAIWHNSTSTPSPRPTQSPFDLNDPRDPKQREAAIYNWTPEITDVSDKKQELTYQASGLDDLNTENPRVIEALKDSHAYWIREVGADAFRIDTAKYVKNSFYEEFLYGDNGIIRTALSTGREDFYTIGEIYITSDPMSDNGEVRIADYLDTAEAKRIQAPIGFPLYKTIERVFARGRPTRQLTYRLDAQMRAYPDPYRAANFIDNHDVERYLSHGDMDSFRQAYAFLMTVPGVPVIYQGDEQGFTERRQAMFQGGYLSDQDQFDENAPMYRHIQSLAHLRKSYKAFSRGSFTVVADSPTGAGVFAYKRSYDGHSAYVLFNTADHHVLLNSLITDFSNPKDVQILFKDGPQSVVKPDARGVLTASLGPKSTVILYGKSSEDVVLGRSEKAQSEAGTIKIFDVQERYINQESAEVHGIATPNAKLLRVIDGNLTDAKRFSADSSGRWAIDIPVRVLGKNEFTLEIYAPELALASEAKTFEVVYEKVDYSQHYIDPNGDDLGPAGRYQKLHNPTSGCQTDIHDVSVQASGPVLIMTLKMCDVSAVWSPPNQFDRVSFNLYFDIPGMKDATAKALPGIRAHFPNGGSWGFVHELYGWNNAIYGGQGSNEHSNGDLIYYSPDLKVNAENNTITITYRGDKIGVEDWGGTSIYITTWDRDGGDGRYRALVNEATLWEYGGGGPEDPLILDDAFVTLDEAQ